MRCIKYVYYKDELMIGDKNDEEEKQCRVGNDNPQEDAHGRTDRDSFPVAAIIISSAAHHKCPAFVEKFGVFIEYNWWTSYLSLPLQHNL